eukprot:scaffold4815_cov107-Cylindrotheca_fusiformis.AAC.4
MPYYSSTEDDQRSAASTKSQVTQQSSHSSSTGHDDIPQNLYTPPVVGKREETNVLRARGLVALILLVAVTGVATAANLLVKHQEQRDFENQVGLAIVSASTLISFSTMLLV